ncbi:MAG: hypothetical protein EPO24_14950 [Bacteroidetes bacterium]|nr:MAG: hypothetical protein EPO24_14950 [Bacteroidota bacterium]
MVKKLGIIKHSYAQPVVSALRKQTPDSSLRFELVQDVATRLVLKLLQDELDGAFLSPIEYAKHSSQLRIVNEICVASTGESGIIELHFRDDLRNIETLAINPEFTSEVILAKIILAEKFDISPQLVAVQSLTTDVIHKADSVLLVGDECVRWSDHANKLDLVDEWSDMTTMAYVHGFWVTKEGNLSKEPLQTLMTDAPYVDALQSRDVSYLLDANALSSIEEFYQMSYYHGILKEIPDLIMVE